MRNNTSWLDRLTIIGLGIAAAGLFGVVSASAATFTVNSPADVGDANLGDGVCETATPGECTLRAAVQQANNDAAADTIVVPAGSYTITDAAEGDFDFDLSPQTVTLSGAGSSSTSIDGGGLDRVFDVVAGVTADFSAITIENGDAQGTTGGGIQSFGSVTLTDVALTDNTAKEGAGVYSSGAASSLTLTRVTVTGGMGDDGAGLWIKDSPAGATLTDVTLNGNTAVKLGGGINSEASRLELTRVTLSSNSAEEGGGLYNKGAALDQALTNVTFSGNSATSLGGGIHTTAGNLTLTNVTMSGNSVPLMTGEGGAIRHSGGTTTLINTILANSTGDHCVGGITDSGNNLADNDTCSPIPNTLSGLDSILADNGGPTQTHALLTGSSAIDAGSSQPPCPWRDQRTFSRIDGACDVGAYEFGAVLPVTLSSFRATPGGGSTLFEWSTATETSNIGFNLYALTGGRWSKVNGEPIPSRVVDSLEPQEYEYLADVEGDRFFIEDLDAMGRTELHGPFAPHLSYGGGSPPAEPIDWQVIRRQRRELPGERRTAAVTIGDSGPGGGPESWGAASWHRPRPARRSRSMQLLVDQTGLYRVTYEALLDAGLDLAGYPTEALALTNRGTAVPVFVRRAANQHEVVPQPGRHGARARLFGPGGFIEFYGEALDTLYTKTNVYELRADARRARRVETEGRQWQRSGSPPRFYLERLLVERNRHYNLTAPSRDPWFDTRLLAYNKPVTVAIEFEVDQLVAGDASLKVELLGLSGWPNEPDHHVEVRVNGSWVAETRFDERTAHSLEAELPPRLLAEGTNTLELTLPADTGASWDMVALDRFRVSYPRRFVARGDRLDFTSAGERFRVAGLSSPRAVVYRLDGKRVTRLQGVRRPGAEGWTLSFAGVGRPARYLVSTVEALRAPRLEPPSRRAGRIRRGAAEYLIISHRDFLPGLDPLIAERERQGLSVKAVDVEDVYQRFGHGILDPEAIRRYIAFAARRLGTRQVLLVGGDSYDYHDYLGRGAVSFLPSLYAATDEIIRFAPVDPLYADVDGDRGAGTPTTCRRASISWRTRCS